MFDLQPPRHISTLPISTVGGEISVQRSTGSVGKCWPCCIVTIATYIFTLALGPQFPGGGCRVAHFSEPFERKQRRSRRFA
jgi:hypothetical protein